MNSYAKVLACGRLLRFVGLLALAAIITPTAAVAGVTYTWIDPAVSGNWSDATKWSGGVSPPSSNGTDLVFGGSANYTATADKGTANFVLNSLYLGNTAGTCTLAAGTTPGLDFQTDPVTSLTPEINKTGAGASVLNMKLVVTNNLTVNVAAGAGQLTLGPNNTTTNISGAGSITVNNASNNDLLIADLGGLTGNLNINSGKVKAVNTSGDLLGNTTVVVLAAGASFNFNNNAEDMGACEGAGDILLGTANMTWNKAGSRTFSGTVAGSGTFTISHAATDTLTLGGTGTSTKTGTYTLTRGALQLADSNDRLSTACYLTLGGTAAATLKLDGRSQLLSGLASTNAGSRVVNGNATLATLSLSVPSATTRTFAGVLGGSGADENNLHITIRGAGTQVLSGANSFGGTLTVSDGNLSIATINAQSADGVLGNSANAVVLGANGATGRLLYTGASATTNKNFTMAAGGTGIIEVNASSAELTLSGVIDGSGVLEKRGLGALILSGENTLSGGLKCSAGTLALDYTSSTAARLPTGATVTMAGGAFELRGNATAPITQDIGLAIATNTASAVRAVSNGGQAVTLNLSSIAVGAGGSVNFTLPADGAITTPVELGPWATVNQTALATKVGNAIAAAAYSADDYSGPTINTDVTLPSNSPSTFTVNTLRFNTSANTTLTLTGANALAGGAILVTANVGASSATITGGTLVGSSGGSLSIGQNNTGAGFTIASAIADNGAATGLAKFGTGTLTLTGNNTYTGLTSISGGRLVVGSTSALPAASAATVAAGATLQLNVANPSMGALTIASGGTLDLNGRSAAAVSLAGAGAVTSSVAGATTFTFGDAANTSFSGVVSNGAGTVTLKKQGAGTVVLSGTSTFSGGLQVLGGAVEFSAVANLGANAGTVTFNNGAALRYTGGATLNISNNHPFVFTGNGVIDVPSTTAGLTSNTNSWSGTGALTKTGPGTLSLGSDGNGHTGTVVVQQGVLRLTSRRIPSITGLTVATGGQYKVEDDLLSQNFGFASGALTLSGFGPNTDGALSYVAQGNVLGSMYIPNNVTLAADAGVFVMAGDSTAKRMTLQGTISGPGALTKMGAGYLEITGDASSLPGITVADGTLEGRADYLPANLSNNGLLIYNQPFDITRNQAFQGTGALIKRGVGRLTLTGDNTYGGSTTVAGGDLVLRDGGKLSASTSINLGLGARLVLDNTGGPVVGNRLVSGASLTLGGTVQFLGAANTASSQTIGNVSVTGLGTIDVVNGAGSGTAELALGSISRDARGALVTFTGTGATKVQTPPSSMAGWGLVGDQWAKFDGSGRVIAFQAGDYSTQTDPSLWIASDHVKIAAALAGPIGTRTIASLAFAAEQAVTISASETLTIAAGGILANSNGTINGPGTLIGGQTVNPEIVAVVNGTNRLVVNAVLGDTGGQSFTKVGAGTVALTGVNQYSAGTNIFGGVLEATTDGNLGQSGSAINLNGGSLRIFGDFLAAAGTRPIVLGSANGAVDTNGFTLEANTVSGDGTLAKRGDGTLSLGYVSTFTGGLILERGTVAFTGATAGGTGTAGQALGADTAPVAFGGGTLELVGTTEVNLGALHPFRFNGDGTVKVGTGTPGTSNTLTTNTNNWTGQGTLTKTGLGILALGSGGSGHTGAVVVAEGILRIYSERIPNISGLTVASGAQFQINDDVNGANFSFASGPLTLSGRGPSDTGALLYTPQSDSQGVASINNAVVLAADTRISVVNSATYVYELVLAGAVSGAGKLEKSGAGVLTLTGLDTRAAGSDILEGVLNYSTSADQTLAGVIAGAGILSKSSSGTLSHTANSTYSGATSINQGSLVLKDGGRISATSLVAVGYNSLLAGHPLAARVFPGARLVLDNTGSSASADRVHDSATVSLAGQIELKGAPGASSSETLGTVTVYGGAASELRTTPAAAGTADLTLAGLQRGGSGAVVFLAGAGTTTVGSADLTGGILGYGVVGNDWATLDASNRVVALNAYQTGGDPATWAPADNVKIIGAVAPTDTRTVNSLNLQAAQTLTINSGQRLTLAAGGILASATSAIQGGAIGGNQSANKELLVVVNGPANVLMIGATIDNSAPQGLTKAGDGVLKLTAADNTYTGTTSIYGGAVEISNIAQLGTSTAAIVLNGGGLRAAANVVPATARPLVAGVAGAVLDTNGFELKVGAISGPGSVTKKGLGVLHLNGSNSFLGDLNVEAGEVSLTSTSGSWLTNDGYLNVAPGATFKMNDNTEDFGGISGGGNIETGTNPGTVLNLFGIRNTEFSGVISGAGYVIKNGPGTTIFSNNNTYAGNTVVSAGKLVVQQGIHNAPTTATTSVATGAKLEAKHVRQNVLSIAAGATAEITTNPTPTDKAATVSVLTSALAAPGNALQIAAGGALDLNNNDLIAYYAPGAGASTLATMQQYIYDGFLGTSGVPTIKFDTTTGTYQTYAVAFDNAALSTPWTSWAGQSLTGTNQIITKYTFRGDMDLNGVVDGNDFTIIQQNFGAGSGSPLTPPVGNAVPEPSTLALVILAALGATWCWCRRR